ncbi:MAG TPA: YIEGIA family protein [Bacilli bacterium]|nr:YIEGIA family protein [Bacilli bacterium]
MFDWLRGISDYTMIIIVGTVMGVLCRLSMLKTDYRQYPTYPHGRIVHIALGVIASGLGAVLIPSILQKNYTAVTFLAMAASQFRDVRNMERQMLTNCDSMELVPRGITYIEGIAMAFEGRNYLVILTAFFAALAAHFFHWYGGVIVGGILIYALARFMSGRSVGDIAKIREGKVHFKGANLHIDDILIYNAGLKNSQERLVKNGVGIILEPINADANVTLSNLGQRQAIMHDVSTILGVYRDSGEPSLIPLAKRDLDTGRLAIFLLPLDRDVEKVKAIVAKSPVLEAAHRRPLQADVQPDTKL